MRVLIRGGNEFVIAEGGSFFFSFDAAHATVAFGFGAREVAAFCNGAVAEVIFRGQDGFWRGNLSWRRRRGAVVGANGVVGGLDGGITCGGKLVFSS